MSVKSLLIVNNKGYVLAKNLNQEINVFTIVLLNILMAMDVNIANNIEIKILKIAVFVLTLLYIYESLLCLSVVPKALIYILTYEININNIGLVHVLIVLTKDVVLILVDLAHVLGLNFENVIDDVNNLLVQKSLLFPFISLIITLLINILNNYYLIWITVMDV